MLVKTVLNKVEHFKSFVFGTVIFEKIEGAEALVIEVNARANSKPECSKCEKKGKPHGTLPSRLFEYVPF